MPRIQRVSQPAQEASLFSRVTGYGGERPLTPEFPMTTHENQNTLSPDLLLRVIDAVPSGDETRALAFLRRFISNARQAQQNIAPGAVVVAEKVFTTVTGTALKAVLRPGLNMQVDLYRADPTTGDAKGKPLCTADAADAAVDRSVLRVDGVGMDEPVQAQIKDWVGRVLKAPALYSCDWPCHHAAAARRSGWDLTVHHKRGLTITRAPSDGRFHNDDDVAAYVFCTTDDSLRVGQSKGETQAAAFAVDLIERLNPTEYQRIAEMGVEYAAELAAEDTPAP